MESTFSYRDINWLKTFGEKTVIDHIYYSFIFIFGFVLQLLQQYNEFKLNTNGSV